MLLFIKERVITYVTSDDTKFRDLQIQSLAASFGYAAGQK